MSKYRILKIASANTACFKVQKKFMGLFWYNPLNIDGATTGYFDDLRGAENAIKRLRAGIKTTVVKIYEN